MRQAREDWRNHHYTRAIGGFVKREWPVIAWVISFVLIAYAIVEVSTFSGDLRNGLVQSCEDNGNPLREYLRDEARSEITEARSFNYEEFFPNVPPSTLDALLREEIADAREALNTTLAPLPCNDLYPK
jgi:hypothetical protein